MKKIFSIISAVICGLVIVFISTLSFIKTNVAIIQNNPVSIYVFNESTTATKANGYTKDNAEFNEILKKLKKVSSVSIFTRLVNQTDATPKVEQDLNGTFTSYSTDIKQENIVIELVYDNQQDIVVYVGEDTRVISYFCLSYVIPVNNKFADVVIYYATTNSDDSKNESYASCDPLVIKGKAGSFQKFVDKLV